MAFNLVLQCFLQVTEGVQVFYFDLGAEFFRSARAHAYVGIAAKRAFFHVAIADAGVKHDLAERGEVGIGLLGRAHVRFGDDFAEGRATAIVVDVRLGGGLRETFVEIFRCVFFQVKPRDANPFLGAANFDFQPATGSEGQFVLRDLVALGQIGVEIVFSGEARMFVDRAIQGERGTHGHFDGALVHDGESSRQAEAHRADVGVRRIAEPRRAAAKDLRSGEQLDVDFQADDRLVFREHFRRQRSCLWSGFRHNRRRL